MPEGVRTRARADEHVAVDGPARRFVEGVAVEAHDVREKLVGDPATGDGCGPHDASRRVVECVDPHEQQDGEVVGDGSPTGCPRGHQLLDEERVALGPRHDAAQVVLGDRSVGQVLHEAAYVGIGQRFQREAGDAGQSCPLGDDRT